ncbi:BMA-FIGL-1 [Dirofilaria immitis]|nr:BMA-FIGL-1 [Dirofilaria immitis]
MPFDSIGSEKSLEKLVNRKRANSNDLQFIDLNQKESETIKRKLFDFSHDPKVLEVQQRILNSIVSINANCYVIVSRPLLGNKKDLSNILFGQLERQTFEANKNASSMNESDVKYPCSINSDKNVESRKCYPIIKKNGVFSESRFNTHFKSASGRPLIKRVLPVFASNVNADKDKTQRYLGGKRVILAIHNKGNESVQNKQTIFIGGCGASNKRKGWKADESLKNFDDNVLNVIEAEIMSTRADIKWTDVSGLEAAKKR